MGVPWGDSLRLPWAELEGRGLSKHSSPISHAPFGEWSGDLVPTRPPNIQHLLAGGWGLATPVIQPLLGRSGRVV